MRSFGTVFALTGLLALPGALAAPAPPAAAGTGDSGSIHEVVWVVAETDALPVDALEPEGKTRWQLEGLVGRERVARGIERHAAGLRVVERLAERDGTDLGATRFEDAGAAGSAARWLLPHEDAELLATRDRTPIELLVRSSGGEERLRIDARRVGLGWAHLPSGPREVVLERALVLRLGPDGIWLPHEIVHRWIDARSGVVAEVSGPASQDGTRRLGIGRAGFADARAAGGAPFRFFLDQLNRPLGEALQRIRYGYDQERHCSVGGNPCNASSECSGGGDFCAEIPVGIVDPAGHATMADLVAAGEWDFSGNTLDAYPDMEVVASTTVPLSEILGLQSPCGFAGSMAEERRVSHEAKNPDQATPSANHGNLNVTASSTARVAGTTGGGSAGNVFLRGAVRNQGITGVGLGARSQTCHDPETGRTPVPLWRAANQVPAAPPGPDAGAWYIAVGDQWSSTPAFDCEQTIFTNAVITQTLRTEGCDTTGADPDLGVLSGTQEGRALASGPVTLPSGHTFEALVVRSNVEYCVWPFDGCSIFQFESVRTVIHLWEVPFVGTVARLMSNTAAPSPDGFTTLDETDIKYGLLPPVSIAVDATGGGSVDLSWDPGAVPGPINDGFKVYWDTVSGATTAGQYAFDSEGEAGQVQFGVNGPNTARVSGLADGVEHFFAVTSKGTFTPPHLCANNPCAPGCPGGTCAISDVVVRSYESAMFPLLTSTRPQLIPMEVAATPGGACTPTAEVSPCLGPGDCVTASRVGSSVELCWNLVSDPCVEGYRVLGATSPEAVENFSPEIDTGVTNCVTFAPAGGYFLVVGVGSGGTGPLGHFGQ